MVIVLLSAVRTVVVPRGDPIMLTRAVFLGMRRIFDIRVNRAKTYEQRDGAMALYAPLSLVALPGVWVALMIVAFAAMYWGFGVNPLGQAVRESGSSLLTLGFVAPSNVSTEALVFLEGALGLGLIALLISYLPSIYSAFQRRELQVTLLTTRAGEPPTATEMIIRHSELARFDELDAAWPDWETWFADIEETHTSQPSLVLFRSISHERSWITSAGVVLDCAALRSSTLDLPSSPSAQLCIRAGYLALRRIADYFDFPFPSDPAPDDPISIDRSEFDAAYDQLQAAGVPLKPDRDQAWRDFAGWRVNYDAPLLAIAGFTMAPYAPWSSDRSFRPRRPSLRPPLLRRHRPRS